MKKILIFLYTTIFCLLLHGQAITDLPEGIQLCGTQPIIIEKLSLSDANYIGSTACAKDFPERHSQCFQWQCSNAGKIAFVLHPLRESDDLDFVLLKREGDSWEVIRCMASGLSDKNSEGCLGATGIASFSDDIAENSGCALNKDNFLQELEASEGDEFSLIINNYHGERGFCLEYIGTAIPMSRQINIEQTAIIRKEKEIKHLFTTTSRFSQPIQTLSFLRSRDRIKEYRQAMALPILKNNLIQIGCFNSNDEMKKGIFVIEDPLPNPTKEEFSLILEVPISQKIKISIQHSNGDILLNKDFDLPAGKQRLFFDSSEWASGSYLVSIHGINQTLSKKIIKL